MARYKVKESHPFTIRMDQELFKKLNAFCEDSGQSKTVAVERALKEYIERYETEREILKGKEQ